jgi:hypothetical protein
MMQVDPNLDAATAKEYLKHSADKIDKWRADYGPNGHSDTHGHGRVNACSAVRMAAEDATLGECPQDRTPYWLLILILALPIVGFVTSGFILGWCHVVTCILGGLSAGVITFAVAWYLAKKINGWFWWLALGVAAVVFVIFWILC